MQAVFDKLGKRWTANLDVCWDLSVSTGPQGDNPSAFYIDAAKFEPIRVGGFVGSVAEGGSANCEILTLCAHGNGTHTECVGHITMDKVALSDLLKQFWFDAQLVGKRNIERLILVVAMVLQHIFSMWKKFGCMWKFSRGI